MKIYGGEKNPQKIHVFLTKMLFIADGTQAYHLFIVAQFKVFSYCLLVDQFNVYAWKYHLEMYVY